jgi:hypothetical protein
MPDDNTQQPQPTVSTVDQNQITPEIADPNQGQQPAPSLFQSAMAPVVQQQNSQQPNPQPDPAQINAAREQALETHPEITKAHLTRKIGETLAGGKQYREKIDADGNVTREPIPMSASDLLKYSVANVLGGISQMAGGVLAARQHRAPPPIQPLPSQVAQQQRNQQSEEDYNRQENAKVRQAKVINANLEAMRAKYAFGKELDANKQAVIANHAADYEQAQKDGNIEADNIPDSQLLKQNFDKSKYIVIPKGLVPVYKQDGSGERATDSNGVPLSEFVNAVVDGTTQVPLTQEKYNQLAQYGLMRAKEGFNLPEGSTVTRAVLNQMTHKMDLANQTQNEINEVVGEGKVNLAAKLKENPSLWKAIETFHNDAASQNPIDQLNTIRAKNPQVAGAMMELFGGQPALDAFAAKTQTAEDLTPDKAQSIVSDPRTDKNSPAYQKAVNFLKNSRTQKAQTAADETTARTQAEAAASPASAGLAVPKGFTLNPNSMEMDPASLQSDLEKQGVKVPSNFAALHAVALNAADLKTLPTRTAKGTNQMDAQTGLSFIRQYINPQYQEGDYAAASSLSKELASTRQGTAGGSLLSAGVASNHLALLDEAATALKNNDTQKINALANSLGVQLGKSPAVTFSAISDQVNAEVAKVVAGGTPHEAELAKLAQNLNTDQSPEQVQSVIKAYIGLMSGRVNEINERSQQYFGRDVKGVSPEVAKTFAKYGVSAPGYVSVKVNGQSGVIPKSKLADFKKKYPGVEVGGQ